MPRPLLQTCARPGCSTLTMGELCLAHELPVLRTFGRGRPFRRTAVVLQPAARALAYGKK
ncbi:MAG TPA: hypothetical protein VF094_02100 [Gaiellaceae bacterium]